MNPNQIAHTYLVQITNNNPMASNSKPEIYFLYETHGDQWVLWKGQGSMKLISEEKAQELLKNKLIGG